MAKGKGWYTVEIDRGRQEVTVVLGGERYRFSLTIPQQELEDPLGRERVHSFVAGVIGWEWGGVPISVAEGLLDFLDERFPVAASGLLRPRFRLF